MTAELEQRLRDALRLEAQRAPELAEERCTGPDGIVAESTSNRPGRSRAWLVVAAVAAVGLGTAAVLSRSPSTVISAEEPATQEPTSDFEPDGIETVLSASTEPVNVNEIAKPGTLYRFAFDGHPDNVVFETILFDPFIGRVDRIVCHYERGSGGCGAADSDYRTTPNVSRSSSVDNGVAETNLVSWINLPAEVAFVTYDAASGEQWQRPVGGAAYFVHDQSMSMAALGADGTILATMPPSSVSSDVSPVDFWGAQDGADEAGMTTLDETARETLRECLDRSGAVWTAENAPSFESDQIANEVWDACETETIDAVEDKRAELDLPPPTG